MTTATDDANSTHNPKAYRLPDYALPRRYDIELDARVGRDTFTGKVTIQLDIREGRSSLELHAHELLTLKEATITAGGSGKTLKGEIKQDSVREMAAIEFGEALPVGEGTLVITYDGRISPTLEGLYLADDGANRCLCTQCEETDARKIFPCWDEPAFKARFAWQITTDPQNTVLANGPLVSVEETTVDEGLRTKAEGNSIQNLQNLQNPRSKIQNSKTWSFAPTKPMSSYLCALVIGDIAGTKEDVVHGIPIRIWAMRGKEEMGKFAHDFTRRLLPYYEDYFQAPYHFDKYDQVAVPGFASGAMENVGLVLYVQSGLLMNPQTASWAAEKTIAHVIAHETAHMWFGDLVTMEWWDDLWLNEAFAEWMSYKAMNILNPEYKIWNDALGGKNTALVADALESTHPIYTHVETPAEATELFDAITYQKGCSVMRMLENFLGEEAFRAGLRTYMKEFAESNATGADLWRHLDKASNQPVDSIMRTWIAQGGYPVIHLEVVEDGGRKTKDESTDTKSKIRIQQSRFFSSPNAKETGQVWSVPIVMRYEDGAGVHEHRALLATKEMELELPVVGELKWLYANVEEIGFYRQHLDSKLLEDILANLDKLSPVEQAGLLGDQWALTRNGTQTMPQFLEVMSALSSSKDYTLLENLVGRLHTIKTFLEEAGDQDALSKFNAWVEARFQGQMRELGYEPRQGESQDDKQRRISLIDAMSTVAGSKQAVEEATKWADREAENTASVSPDLAGLFVAAAAQYGDRKRFDKYVEIYKARRESGASPQETNRYLYSLADFEAPSLVQTTLGLIDNGAIPQEAIGRVLRQMLALSHAKAAAWEYMKQHWPTIRNLGDMWTGFLVEATGQLPAAQRADIVRFYDYHLQGVAGMSYARALETLDQLAEFKERTKADLVGWFKQR